MSKTKKTINDVIRTATILGAATNDSDNEFCSAIVGAFLAGYYASGKKIPEEFVDSAEGARWAVDLLSDRLDTDEASESDSGEGAEQNNPDAPAGGQDSLSDPDTAGKESGDGVKIPAEGGGCGGCHGCGGDCGSSYDDFAYYAEQTEKRKSLEQIVTQTQQSLQNLGAATISDARAELLSDAINEAMETAVYALYPPVCRQEPDDAPEIHVYYHVAGASEEPVYAGGNGDEPEGGYASAPDGGEKTAYEVDEEGTGET